MSKYEINKLKDWSAEALHTRAVHHLWEKWFDHISMGGENSPAYIILPLQLIFLILLLLSATSLTL